MAPADRNRKVRRRTYFLLILLLLFINFFGWIFYLSIRETLDDELGYRLVYIANTAALLIDGNTVTQFKSGDESKPDYLTVQAQLTKIKMLNYLREVFIIDRNMQTLVDANTVVPIGYRNRLLEVDATEIETTWTGLAQASVLYSLKHNFYKRGYAPIHDKNNRVVAVLGIEAGVHFSQAIIRIRNSVLSLGIVSLILIIATILIMNRLYTILWKLEEQILSADKFRAIGQLAAGVAHEIRNPLGITRGTAELLKDELEYKEKALTRVNDIIHEVDRMNLIITNFLDFSRSTSLQVTMQNINQIIEKTLQLCQFQLEQAQIICIKEFAPNLPALKIDGQQMIQVFLNLILNARDAMPQGGTLTIKTWLDKNWINIEIHDTGIGISTKQQTQIFEPFYSTKREGIGLGLTISKRIIENHQGTIAIDSELNKGTTIQVRIPI